jgi:predicted amino acid racemase
MFLEKTEERNKRLIETAVKFHQSGKILPDTFVVDVDQFLDNAKDILDEANKNHIELYYMLKQIGRNPYLGKALEQIGYKGAVSVDWKEADAEMRAGLHLSHVGHLVQIPTHFLRKIMSYGCDWITIFSLEKLKEIDEVAGELGIVQKVLIRIFDEHDHVYSGQTGGFALKELQNLVKEASSLSHVKIAGVTSFPCFLFDEESGDIQTQQNLMTILEAKEILTRLGIKVENINAPSTTSVRTIQKMEGLDITSAEPGHGFSGTTPLHAVENCVEKPCVVYLTEVSHNYQNHAYAYGGGYYRRGHLVNALVGKEEKSMRRVSVLPVDHDSIDYYLGLSETAEVGSSVIMAFRFQIFVTRSDVCLLRGLSAGAPEIIGLYDSLGNEISR